jgi:hypothetical protein
MDDDLIAELRELADWIDTPPVPDVRAAVRSRLATRSRVSILRPPWPRRWVAVAAAVAVALALVVLPAGRAAVASAVSGILRFAGVEVRQGPPPHGLPSAAPLPSVRSADLDEARRLAPFPVGAPARLGAPETVQLADPGPDGAPRVVSLLYRGGAVRLDEFDGGLEPGFEKKVYGDAEWVQVGPMTGLWFAAPHELVYVDRQGLYHTETARLAGPTLVWSDGRVTYRLEGVPELAEAVAIAASVI